MPPINKTQIEVLAQLVADRMGVADYTILVTAGEGDTRPAAAYATPASREVHISIGSAEPLTENELVSVLSHEFAHLIVGESFWLKWRQRLPFPLLAAVLGSAVGGLFGFLTPEIPVDDVPLMAWMGVAAVAGGFISVLADQLWRSKMFRALELKCDVERAHAVGTVGLSVFRFDPAWEMSRMDELLNTHPFPETRMQMIIEHQHRLTCRCL